MSHITKVDVVINDLDALAEAAKELGGELFLDQKEYQAYSTKKKCFAAMRFTGASYEVGVQQAADGTFSLEADFYYTGNLTGVVGNDAEKLSQHYKGAAVRSQMKKKGFKVSKSWEESGTMHYEFEKARSW